MNKIDSKGRFLAFDYTYNGIDRVNNDIGYIKNNCIPCCKICNRAKNSMSYDDFLNWIKILVKNNKGLIK